MPRSMPLCHQDKFLSGMTREEIIVAVKLSYLTLPFHRLSLVVAPVLAMNGVAISPSIVTAMLPFHRLRPLPG